MRILYNARVYTQNLKQPTASALAIQPGPSPSSRSGWILAVGEDQEILAEFEGQGELHNLEGYTVIPGLCDAHLHLEHYSLGLNKIDCETATRAACLGRVGERSRTVPPGEWILGHGWNHNDWPEGIGTAADLDAATPEHPVYLTAKSLHAGWANSLALKAAGISSQSSDPPGGRLGRDQNGYPNGILYEKAMELLNQAVPEPSLEQVTRAIQAAQGDLLHMGLTCVHDFDRSRCFTALQTLHQRDDLNLRVVKSIPLEDLPHAVALGLRSGLGDDLLRIGGVKIFADGALGPRTAAMLQPYEGEPDNRGMLLVDAEELFEHGSLAVQHGLSLAVHAIGDRANHEVLNAFSQIREFERHHGLPSLRHRIEHVQLIHPDDAPRLAALGLIASMQPIHATSDMLMADRFWGERAAHSYAWRTQLEHGAVLAFGSDAPVESPNPFWGLHAAVTRRRSNGSPTQEGWRPEQKLTLEEALRGFTYGAAYAAHFEKKIGQLAPGYLADLVVLKSDPFQLQPHELREVLSHAVMIGGEWVWQAG